MAGTATTITSTSTRSPTTVEVTTEVAGTVLEEDTTASANGEEIGTNRASGPSATMAANTSIASAGTTGNGSSAPITSLGTLVHTG